MHDVGGPLGRGVIVLGMHRSGTSAVTGVIDAVGIQASRPEDRMPPRQWNPRGNYESASLSRFDEKLMHHLGGEWQAPPKLGPGWAMDSGLAGFRAEAAKLFADAYPFEPWVWKDPRACVLMPFWDLVLGADMPRILVLRNPLEIAASLANRNAMAREVVFALTERSLHSAISDSAGRPVLVTAYNEVFDDFDGWLRRVMEFMRSSGIAMPETPGVERAKSFLDSDLRHHREPGLELGSETPDGLRRLWAWALERIGAHSPLSIEGLPGESAEADGLLQAHREARSQGRPTGI